MDRDPITGQVIPPTAIQRVLYLAQSVHIYRIPPITSSRGFNAASWTANPADNIFTARIRVVETAIPPANDLDKEKITVNLLLEDPSSSQLFAAAPYNHPSVVEQALDSSRFFAIRVVGERGMKATLGMGFEQRPEAFEFVVTLQDVRRTLGLEPGAAGAQASSSGSKRGVPGRPAPPEKKDEDIKRDLSLKAGEMITINIGGRGKKTTGATPEKSNTGNLNAFAILPPPPSAASVKAERKAESSMASSSSAAPAAAFLPPPPAAPSKQNLSDLGFDDGEFGEFQ